MSANFPTFITIPPLGTLALCASTLATLSRKIFSSCRSAKRQRRRGTVQLVHPLSTHPRGEPLRAVQAVHSRPSLAPVPTSALAAARPSSLRRAWARNTFSSLDRLPLSAPVSPPPPPSSSAAGRSGDDELIPNRRRRTRCPSKLERLSRDVPLPKAEHGIVPVVSRRRRRASRSARGAVRTRSPMRSRSRGDATRDASRARACGADAIDEHSINGGGSAEEDPRARRDVGEASLASPRRGNESQRNRR